MTTPKPPSNPQQNPRGPKPTNNNPNRNRRPRKRKPNPNSNLNQRQQPARDYPQDVTNISAQEKNNPNLYITCLGGLEEVGKNITIFEHQGDILIVDCGLKFATPQMPGIDYTVPDLSYLERNQHRIVGLLITHAHLDHIGAVPYFLKRLNKMIYATRFTRAMIEKAVADKAPEVKLRTKEIKVGKPFQIGSFHIEPIHVNHSIVESIGLAITTTLGTVIHSGDYKIDPHALYEPPTDLARFEELGNKGVLALLSDSTNAINPGYSLSESKIMPNIEKILLEAKGRVLLATFSSQIHRIQKVL
jgi:ribonuclease J